MFAIISSDNGLIAKYNANSFLFTLHRDMPEITLNPAYIFFGISEKIFSKFSIYPEIILSFLKIFYPTYFRK